MLEKNKKSTQFGKKLIGIGLLILILIISCTKPTDPPSKGNISGIVKDAETEIPINSVAVTIPDASTTTNSNGEYSFDDLEPKTYSIHFTKNGYLDNTISVDVKAGKTVSGDVQLTPVNPELNVSNLSLDFGTTLTSLGFTISNTGQGDLEWDITENCSWMSVNPTSGTTTNESSSIVVTVSRSNLDPGHYNESISIASNGGNATIYVAMQVPGPVLDVSTDYLNFGADLNQMNFIITNGGTGTLEFIIDDDNISADWITVNVSSGSVTTQEVPITVTIVRTDLSFGNYDETIIITTTNTNSKVIDIHVDVIDPDLPYLGLSVNNLDFGTDISQANLIVSNEGAGTLNWNASESLDWLELSEYSGSLTEDETFNIIVTVDRSNQTPGSYEGEIIFTSNEGDDIVSVNMVVSATPILFYSPTELDFGTEETSKLFTISNTGNGDLEWELSTNQSWISSIIPYAGTNYSTVNVSIDRSGLSYGEYLGEVSISSNGGLGIVSIIMEYIEPNTPPTALFTVVPEIGTLNTIFNVDASASSDEQDDSSVLQIRWQWEDGGGFTNWTTEKTAEYQYETIGNKIITLEVKDTQGEIGTISHSIEVHEGEEEPNDFYEQAQVISINGNLFGDVGYGGDEIDWFVITMPANGKFQFTITNLNSPGTSNGNLGYVKLYNESLDELTFITPSYPYYIGPGVYITSSTVVVSNNATYYIKIVPQIDHSAPYKLGNTLIVEETDDWGEPNDTQYEATTITETGSTTALIGYGEDDEDWYSITMSNNGYFHFEVTNMNSSGVLYGNLGYIKLYNESLYELTSIGNLGAGGNSTSSTVVVSGEATYFIKILPENINNAAPYELETVFVALEIEDFGEDNNMQYEATAISELGSITALTGYDDDNEDWYSITMSVNGYFYFTVSNLHSISVPNGDLGNVILYDESQNVLTTISQNNLEDGESATSSTVVVSDEATYFIKIVPKSNIHAAPYELETIFSELEYIEYGEPNNVSLQAETIDPNDNITALIGFGDDDQDWYSFDIPADGQFQFRVTNLNPSNVQQGTIYRVYLYNNPDSNPLTYISNLSPGNSANSIVVSLTGGETYYIKVESSSNHAAPYKLETFFTE